MAPFATYSPSFSKNGRVSIYIYINAHTNTQINGEAENVHDISEMVLQKKWTDEKSGAECYMLYARALNIVWSGNSEYWTWNCYKETE